MRSTLNILIKRRKNKFKHSNFLKSLTLKKIMLPKEYSTLNFGNTFSEYLPCFNVSPSSLEILHTPSDFFEQIKERILKSKKRITLSSLYIGTEPTAIEMIDCIHKSLELNHELQVTILIDHLRGMRNTSKSKKEILSSCTNLLPLLQKFPDRTCIKFYHTPNLSGIFKKIVPERYNELLGVHHIKAYLFDDSLLISGANLSEQYFTNRQDRYTWINDDKLTQFYDELIKTIGSLSHSLNTDGELILEDNVPDPSIDPDQFNKFTNDKIETFIKHYREKCPFDPTIGDTWIFPTVQIGPSKIDYDRLITKEIFKNTPPDSSLYLTSPYFNFTDEYQQLILENKANNIEIIVASPQANGFYTGKGLSGSIPWAYNLVLKKFFEELNESHKIILKEYIKDNWTFHGKGVWIDLGSENSLLTLIGSSNFGVRSVERDVESQVVILTKNANLIEKFKEERDNIFKDSKVVKKSTFDERKDSENFWLPFVVPFAKKFM